MIKASAELTKSGNWWKINSKQKRRKSGWWTKRREPGDRACALCIFIERQNSVCSVAFSFFHFQKCNDIRTGKFLLSILSSLLDIRIDNRRRHWYITKKPTNANNIIKITTNPRKTKYILDILDNALYAEPHELVIQFDGYVLNIQLEFCHAFWSH